jgi:hypothetical protein
VFDVDSKNHSETSAERVLRLMRFGKDQCIEVLCQTQTEHSDGSLRSDGSRGEGNRPRLIYAIREVQELMLEIIGKCGLNLFDEDGNRLINEKTPSHTIQAPSSLPFPGAPVLARPVSAEPHVLHPLWLPR